MCGIIGAIAKRNVTNLLVDNLKKLEYRGYDSAGVAVIDENKKLQTLCVVGKIAELSKKLEEIPISGNIGIAHTRWATHGAPSEKNAHPHTSNGTISLVHNGIIENYLELKKDLLKSGYEFASETDAETIVHLIHKYHKQEKSLLNAVFKATQHLHGTFALAVINKENPDEIVITRFGSPLVIGIGEGENYIASDSLALLSLTKKFIYLEEGDIARVTLTDFEIYNIKDGILTKVTRPLKISEQSFSVAELGNYNHYMQKEIFEEPIALAETIVSSLDYKQQIRDSAFGNHATKILSKIKYLQISACGSSFHAASIARYWFEDLANISCKVEISSELRYRKAVVEPNTLFVTISQSGETADALAALRKAKELGYAGTLTICNVPESSLVRESDLVFMTRAGVEIGVATTKAFVTQLVALFILTLLLGKYNKQLNDEKITLLLEHLKHTPALAEQVLLMNNQIKKVAKKLVHKEHAFFLGRGVSYPVAMEGALKMKEISYIHAESYAAGELKHGPLALIDSSTPVIIVAPNDELIEKLKSNIQEVKARGGEVIIFADEKLNLQSDEETTVINIPAMPKEIAPIIYTIPLQLLSYHVAVLKGTDVDKPRNLAKSVTVE